MAEKSLTVSQIYARGKENLKKRGVEWFYPGGRGATSIEANRKFLASLFFETRLLDPVEVDTSFNIFGRKLKTPVFCSAISRVDYMTDTTIAEIARGIANAGSFIMVGIGGSNELQSAIDTGANVVKMVKPYRKTELIYEKVRDAESRGCMAVGLDTDHFHGRLGADGDVTRTETFGPQSTEVLRQVISQTKLPFIIKGILSVTDAKKAVQLGASAIVVSNHGTGSFEYSVPSVIALPKIVEAVGDKLTVLIDSGFQTGVDALKALALGAKGVGFANPMILAWAADSTQGVEMLVNQLTAELSRTMAGAGCPSLEAINRSIIMEITER